MLMTFQQIQVNRFSEIYSEVCLLRFDRQLMERWVAERCKVNFITTSATQRYRRDTCMLRKKGRIDGI